MTLVKIVSFLLLTVLSIQRIQVRGEIFLPSTNDKDQTLKTIDKRMDNFRVPAEMPFDPNFWPARGRRGRVEGQNENCEESGTGDRKEGLQCRDGIYLGEEDRSKDQKSKGAEEDFARSRRKIPGYCFGLPKMSDECREKLKWKIPNILDGNLITQSSNRMNVKREKIPRYYNLPTIMWLDEDFFWKPEFSYGEKEKKQDIFWVSRGKKGFE